MSTYLPAGLPAPRPDALDAPYWEGAARGVLRIQRCTRCASWQWGPECICHQCHGFDLGWQEVAATGRIYSWSRVWHPVHPALSRTGPYLLVLVELPQAGSVRLLGNLLGDPMQAVALGAPVEAVFETHRGGEGDYGLVQWRAPDITSNLDMR